MEKINSEFFPKSIFNVFCHRFIDLYSTSSCEWRNNLSVRKITWNFHEDILFYHGTPWERHNDGQIRSGMHPIDWNWKNRAFMQLQDSCRTRIFRESNFFAHILIRRRSRVIRVNVLKINIILIQVCTKKLVKLYKTENYFLYFFVEANSIIKLLHSNT